MGCCSGLCQKLSEDFQELPGLETWPYTAQLWAALSVITTVVLAIVPLLVPDFVRQRRKTELLEVLIITGVIKN